MNCIKIMQDKNQNCKVKNSKIWQTLILQNCLPLGAQARFTSKNVTQYLLGSRNNYDLFKINEIKHLLLKFTPLIETLFRSKLVLNAKVGGIHKTRIINPTPPKDPTAYEAWYEKMKNVKIKKHINHLYYQTVENKRPIKILFASTNPTYNEIIKKSAEICQMSAHTNRWLCGYITANSTTLSKTTNEFSVEKYFVKTFHENKESKENFYQWHRLNELSHRPAIAIIPDIKNNDMILRETFAKDIPVIGLINSDDSVNIAYPIFGNSDSIQVTHFFCNFLAVLIAKAFVQQEYKQNSHRIINRSRAYFAIKNQQLTESNIYPQSKHENANNYKFFYQNTVKKFGHNDFNNFYNFARFKRQKKLAVSKTMSNDKTIKTSTGKKRVVGTKPYWKNLKMMIVALTGIKPKKYPFVIEEIEEDILVKDIAKKLHVKKKLRNWAHKQAANNLLLTKYVKKLKELTTTKSLTPHSFKIMTALLNRHYRKSCNKFGTEILNANFLEKNHMEINEMPSHLMYESANLGWKKKKAKKRKVFVKAFGHKKLVRKKSRASFQLKSKIWVYKKTEKVPTLKLTRTLRRLQSFENQLKNNTSELDSSVVTQSKNSSVLQSLHSERLRSINKIAQISNKLLVHKVRSANLSKTWDPRLVLTKLSKNKKLFSVMLKKYPYLTLTTKSVSKTADSWLKKRAPTMLLNELINVKKNPYVFSMKNFRRTKAIANNLVWDKLYAKQWKIKENKKSIKEKIYNSWTKSKILSKGPIKFESKNKIYDFRRLVFLKNRKSVPKFLTKIKASTRNPFRVTEKKQYEDMWYDVWYKNTFALKYHRAIRIIPDILNNIKYHESRSKFIPRHVILAERDAEKAKFKQEKYDKWLNKAELLYLEAKAEIKKRKEEQNNKDKK